MTLTRAALARYAGTAIAVGLGAAGLSAAQAGASGHSASAASERASTASTATVSLRSTKFGKILVNAGSGLPLYLYTADSGGRSACSGMCASFWPPLLTSGKPRAGRGVAAFKLGEIKRGNSHQVTYAGHPLYTFTSDSRGVVTGERAPVGNGTFYVVSASGRAVK